MIKQVEVEKGIYNALNEWYANGYDGMELVTTYKVCKDNGLGFKEPFEPLSRLSKQNVLTIGAVGVGGYRLLESDEDLIKRRYDNSTEEEKELIKWLLDTLGDCIPGVN